MKNNIDKQNENLNTIDYLLSYCKIDDIILWYDKRGTIHAKDSDGTKWKGRELYDFITNEVLCFDANGELLPGMYVPPHILEPYKKLSIENGVIPGQVEA